jgi:hypothetical protein
MSRFTRSAWALAAALGVTLVAAAAAPSAPRAARAQVQQKERADKTAALIKAISASKTPLAEAIALVEKETGGKVYSAELVLDKQDKPEIEIGLLSGERLTRATVDPETKKVTVTKRKRDQGAEEGGGQK